MKLLAVLVPFLGLSDVDLRVTRAVAELAPDTEAVVVQEVASGQILGQSGAAQRPLPPGSTFKIVDVVAAADHPDALTQGVRCDGRPGTESAGPGCAATHGGHGTLDLEGALATSCNLYFAHLGRELGTRALLDTARALGVGLPPGRLPAEEAPAGWVADGDGVRVTALQLAELLRQVARGVRRDGVPLMDATTLARLRRGLQQAVLEGTASAARASIPVAGKTGTAVLGRSRIGWFAGYAPAEDPTVVLVLARRGARGAEVARLVPPLLEAFFHGHGHGHGHGRGHGARPTVP